WLAYEIQKVWISTKLRNTWLWPGMTAAFVALVPVELHFSRVGFEGHLAVSLLVLAVASLLNAHTRKYSFQTAAWTVLATLLASAATYAYFSTRFVWPGVALALVLSWSLGRLTFANILRSLV